MYDKLLANKVVGAYIREFYQKKGMTLKSKLAAIATMWVMITLSTVFFIEAHTVKIVVLGLGVVGTIVISFIITTVSDSKDSR